MARHRRNKKTPVKIEGRPVHANGPSPIVTSIHGAIIVTGVVLLLLFGALASLYIDFLPSRPAVRWGTLAALLATPICWSLWFWMYKSGRLNAYASPAKKISRWGIALMPIFFYFFFMSNFIYSFPWMVHRFCDTPGEIQVTLKSKSKSTRTGYGIEFNEFAYLPFKHLIDIQPGAWHQLKNGDRLTLLGTQSRFGFIVYRFFEKGGREVTDTFYWGRVICPIGGLISGFVVLVLFFKIMDRFGR